MRTGDKSKEENRRTRQFENKSKKKFEADKGYGNERTEPEDVKPED